MLCVSATMRAAAAARCDEGMRAREASRAVSEGVDGVEQRAVRAGHEAEGDDWDEGMAGNENMPAQRGRGQRLDRRHQEEEAETKGKGSIISTTKARWSTTGLGT